MFNIDQCLRRLYGPRREKTCLQLFANNTGADQPAHPRSLISAFVIRFLLSIISRLDTSKILKFLDSLCSGGDWFEPRFLKNPEDRFCHVKAHMVLDYIDSLPLSLSLP